MSIALTSHDEETGETVEFTVEPGSHMHNVFSRPGVRAFTTGRGARIERAPERWPVRTGEYTLIKDDQFFQAFKAGFALSDANDDEYTAAEEAPLWAAYNEWLNEADDDSR